jgi:hypothetical protein
MGDIKTTRNGLMEGPGDGVIGITGVGETDVLPPGQDLLLDPVFRPTEMMANLKVDGMSELDEGRLRVGLKQMVQSKTEGVRNEKHNLVVLEGFCVELKNRLFVLCGWLVA